MVHEMTRFDLYVIFLKSLLGLTTEGKTYLLFSPGQPDHILFFRFCLEGGGDFVVRIKKRAKVLKS